MLVPISRVPLECVVLRCRFQHRHNRPAAVHACLAVHAHHPLTIQVVAMVVWTPFVLTGRCVHRGHSISYWRVLQHPIVSAPVASLVALVSISRLLAIQHKTLLALQSVAYARITRINLQLLRRHRIVYAVRVYLVVLVSSSIIYVLQLQTLYAISGPRAY